ncbi:lysis system i-spanin subunit Rz [Burkholderia glumae]|uniref:lysis system i-spanin subunit Rz n=1 Tax=Burkholderia glumae TaxID=337 RepID=UPI0005B81A6D|nr:lysis system i-spanin subunit Rz [Burkholderia glumae]PJO20707.1 lysozyme [Burkholderia glumae AU6208]QHE09457.1 lysozyme [Burkholderia glumae AU6208]
MLRKWVVYLLVAGAAAGAGAYGAHVFDARNLALERAGRAGDAQQHAEDLLAISRAALDAERLASDAHDAAASRVAAVDAQMTKERMAHETENRNACAALAAGTDRLRIAVRNCSATGSDDVPRASGAASMGDGAAAIADLDGATAERAFTVAGDDQREIDKLRALQAYVCAIRTATPGCGNQWQNKH